MVTDPIPKLEVLIAHERADRLAQVTAAVVGLGYDVIDRTIGLKEVGHATVEARPDVAIVIVAHDSGPQALEAIDVLVKQAACPVIALLDVQDSAFIREAAKRGIFAYITDGHDPQELQSSIDIVLRRFAEYHDLEGAFGRRAVTERAKGILMERHSVDEREAFNMLRDHARRTNRKMVDVAEEIVSTHRLLPGAGRPSAAESTRRAGLVSSCAGRSRARCAPARPGASPRSSTARATATRRSSSGFSWLRAMKNRRPSARTASYSGRVRLTTPTH